MSDYHLTTTVGEVFPPSRHRFETVERKGLGHPDTMADLIAETFCFRYAQYCRELFGFVPNHSADKVTLAGADASVRLGGYEVTVPVGAYYFGKITRQVGGTEIPVEDIFSVSVDDVLTTCTRYPGITEHVTKDVKAVIGKPIDHHPGYYTPESTAQLRSIVTTERFANDTVACAASGGLTPVEQLVMGLERYLQGPRFAAEVDGTGSDIKVLAARHASYLDLTACVPFHPEALDSWDEYHRRLGDVRTLIRDFVDDHNVAGVDEYALNLNGRDVPGRGYLAPFGTCLGKGDVGAVGRGNRYSGLITPGRAMSVEAPAGKNLMHHTGKLYTILAQWIADSVHDQFQVDNEVVITSKVGRRLDEPGSVCVNLAEDGAEPEKLAALVREHIAGVDLVTQHLMTEDPLARTRADYGYPG